jgi:F-type H+-transporting ATPase subunit c
MKNVLSTSLRVTALLALSTGIAFAQNNGGGAAASWGPVGAGLAIGLSALGGGLSQGRTASAGLEGMARNPQAAGSLLTPMIIGLALIESLVLLGFLVTNGLAGKLGG